MGIDVVLSTIILLIVLSTIGGILATMILFMSRDTTRLPEILSRIQNIEDQVTQLSSEVNVELNKVETPQSLPQEVWRSADGKYEAGSLEELLIMMSNDPTGPLDENEIDAIKSAFDKIMGEAPKDDDDEDEPWKRSL